MSKQLIQFAGVLFMLAALLAVSAQENTTSLNNATMNNTTLLNNTTLNASVIEVPILPTETANETASIEVVSAENESALAASEFIPVQNETAPTQIEEIAAQNETVPAQNVTMPVVSRPEVKQIGSPQKSPFALGGGETTPSLIPIGGKVMSQAAYEVGLPAKTIMDLSTMPFSFNKM